jgi:hypothetical protein
MDTLFILSTWVATIAFWIYLVLSIVILFFPKILLIWRILPLLLVIVIIVSPIISTPGEWSDTRSHWLPLLLVLICVLMIGGFGFRYLVRGRIWIERLLGGVGLIFLIGTAPLFTDSVITTALFYQEVMQKSGAK